jgi:hypothetical protein
MISLACFSTQKRRTRPKTKRERNKYGNKLSYMWIVVYWVVMQVIVLGGGSGASIFRILKTHTFLQRVGYHLQHNSAS